MSDEEKLKALKVGESMIVGCFKYTRTIGGWLVSQTLGGQLVMVPEEKKSRETMKSKVEEK